MVQGILHMFQALFQPVSTIEKTTLCVLTTFAALFPTLLLSKDKHENDFCSIERFKSLEIKFTMIPVLDGKMGDN